MTRSSHCLSSRGALPLRMLVEKDGERAIIQALLATVPGDRVMAITEELCQQLFGDNLGLQVRPEVACRVSPCSLPRVFTEAHNVLPTLSSAEVCDEDDTASSASRKIRRGRHGIEHHTPGKGTAVATTELRRHRVARHDPTCSKGAALDAGMRCRRRQR